MRQAQQLNNSTTSLPIGHEAGSTAQQLNNSITQNSEQLNNQTKQTLKVQKQP